MNKMLTAVACATGAMFVASANAGVTGISCDPYIGDGWIDNGYDDGALDTYRVYIDFDSEGDQLNAVFGNADNPMWISSSDGALVNSAVFDSLTAPLDLTGIGVWGNQWDTYVTLDTTMNTGDATGLTPGFAGQVGDLAASFTADNASWFVTPDDAPQGNSDGFRVLIAQVTVNAGAGLEGQVNVQLAGGAQTLDMYFNCIPAPGALALLGVAGLAGRRRRRA